MGQDRPPGCRAVAATAAHDWGRFTGSTIGSYLGLVRSDRSSGARRARGGITKTGNSQARRLPVEADWHHRKSYRPSRELIRRRTGQPLAVRKRAERRNRRLRSRAHRRTLPGWLAGWHRRRGSPSNSASPG
ncbi:transposase [Pseudonocardia adelaidensis]|uniref:transposase n=1 Tax=Pseudonocardia adelaidensis TaxID=648754 RepID=UPI003CD06EA9